MHTKRIIPCLDVIGKNVVKGVNFINLASVGSAIDYAKFYNNEGADELVFLDITASNEDRGIMIDLVRSISEEIFIPFTVGGGLKNINDVRAILKAGADKVSLNSAAVKNPRLIKEVSDYFGSQCMVLAVDAKRRADFKGFNVFINGGRIDTGIDVFKWIEKAEKLGAGEILLTSMDSDGTKKGFDLELLKSINNIVKIPVIASGGAGKIEDFYNVFKEADVDAALAASLFHYEEVKINKLKVYLKENNIKVRI
ncbi:cyclase [Clostridium cavendishii DSM 21758]|uniref:Imidazole glycerol phosphate synthase subunit HisF n=1 Tax=Clostridium cavendishii DSM 21758 TaxID=1121302 RepID=A0A1M6F215_9CLOT|nr:imidazole glycerol phosphate synthase subunit HisF [Clostridium cavendishii]SHI91747.1 cyclase [Clostridium cavendishii DSM 21758]